MGYTQSFMSFVWRDPLPVSPTAFNVPDGRGRGRCDLFGPHLAHDPLGAHQRHLARTTARARTAKALLAALLPRLSAADPGDLCLPPVVDPGARWCRNRWPTRQRPAPATTDPLLFLVPALFTLALSLLLVRSVPDLDAHRRLAGRRGARCHALPGLSPVGPPEQPVHQRAAPGGHFAQPGRVYGLYGRQPGPVAGRSGALCHRVGRLDQADDRSRTAQRALCPSEGAWVLPIIRLRGDRGRARRGADRHVQGHGIA